LQLRQQFAFRRQPAMIATQSNGIDILGSPRNAGQRPRTLPAPTVPASANAKPRAAVWSAGGSDENSGLVSQVHQSQSNGHTNLQWDEKSTPGIPEAVVNSTSSCVHTFGL
jgi:hypothetical protein